MRLTIASKIIFGLGIVVLLGVASMAIIAGGLRAVGRNLDDLTGDKEPLSAAVYEMEINVNGFGLAVLKYQHRADPRFREWALKDEQDFNRFHALFMTLADARDEWQLGEEIGRLFRRYRKTGHVLIRARDRQEAVFAELALGLEGMDVLLDDTIQPQLEAAGLRRTPALTAALDLEADLAEIGLAVARFRLERSFEHRRLVRRQERELRESLGGLRRRATTTAVATATAELARQVDHTMGLVRAAMAIEGSIQRRSLALMQLRIDIDRLLDTELQALSSESLSQPQREAAAATRRVTALVWVLLPLFLASAVIVAVALRAILRPLAALKEGTRKVTGANFGHRIYIQGNDEVADLARAFNHMLSELETTTVSKVRLEDSERRLANTVVTLRHEIGERQRADDERARLEASLRRSEIMSAMGALVAGVAHEVRNPLFAISSVVDALEVRLRRGGQHGEIEPHLEVLRGEVDRMSRLMRELLELGRPSAEELVPAPSVDVVREAIALCTPLAARVGVVIESAFGDGPLMVAMSRERLVQVFRNIVENAIQHSPAGARIRIEGATIASDDGAVVEWVIADAGSGIPDGDVPRLFEPFFSRRHGGTGLGLSIVQRIVEEHHGSVTAGNGPTTGAVFVVRLPAWHDRPVVLEAAS